VEKYEKKGIEKGIEKKTIDVIIKGKQNGISINMLSNITGLSIKEIKKIIEKHS